MPDQPAAASVWAAMLMTDGRSANMPCTTRVLPIRPLERLAPFYGHLADRARGYVKDATERDPQVAIVTPWQDVSSDCRS